MDTKHLSEDDDSDTRLEIEISSERIKYVRNLVRYVATDSRHSGDDGQEDARKWANITIQMALSLAVREVRRIFICHRFLMCMVPILTDKTKLAELSPLCEEYIGLLSYFNVRILRQNDLAVLNELTQDITDAYMQARISLNLE